MVAGYLRSLLAGDPTFAGMKTLFTIHNLGYQGLFNKETGAEIGLDRALFHPGGVEFFGQISFIKAGIVYSDAISTVSRTYAREIQTPEYGFRLDGLLRSRRDVLHGIVNGVDYTKWNPQSDPYLEDHYSAADLSGKQKCKQALLREFGFAKSRPVIGVVMRLASQKGADLIAEAGEDLAKENIILIVLRADDAQYEKLMRDPAQGHPDKIGVRLGASEAWARPSAAGADSVRTR